MKIEEIKFKRKPINGQIFLMQAPFRKESETVIKLSKKDKEEKEKEEISSKPYLVLAICESIINEVKFKVGDFVDTIFYTDKYRNSNIPGQAIQLIENADIPFLNPIVTSPHVITTVVTEEFKEEFKKEYEEIISTWFPQLDLSNVNIN